MSELDRLKDIKPPVEVVDVSFWIILGATLLVLIVLLLLFIWLKSKKRVKRRRFDPTQDAKDRLKNIDFSDTKRAVYTFDEYLPVLIKDDEELLKEFEDLQKDLEKYKYKKDVPSLSKEDIIKMKELIKRSLNGVNFKRWKYKASP